MRPARVQLLPVTRRAPRTLSRITPLRATHYDTSCRSALHGLRTPGRTSPAVDSHAGTEDTSCCALQHEVPRGCAEGLHVLLRALADSPANPHAGRDAVLMHVESTAAFNLSLHRRPPP